MDDQYNDFENSALSALEEAETSNEDQASLSKKAYNYAIRLLGKRDYSIYKMKNKLREKGYDLEIREEVVKELLEKKYLREDLYIEARIKGFIRKGMTTNVILYRLSKEQCHTTQEHIESILAELGLGKEEQLRGTIEKKLRLDGDFVKDKEKLRQKIMRYCISRGHGVGDVSRVYQTVYSEMFPEG